MTGRSAPGPANQPVPLLRFAGRRPDGGVRAPAPWTLASALRDYAKAGGLTIYGLERSRVAISGSIYLTMADVAGRRWIVRVSNHRRPRRTGHALPHVDLVSLDGVAGFKIGRELIDAIIAGTVPWFDAEVTVRRRAQMRKNARIRRR